MSYEHKPYNPNRGGVSRSGFTSESRMADVPQRLTWSDWLLLAAIAGVGICIALGVTVWAPVGRAF